MPHPPSLRRRPRRWDPLPSFRIAVQSTSLSVFECALTSVLSQFWRNVWKPIEESFESLLSASETKVRPSSVGTVKVGKLASVFEYGGVQDWWASGCKGTRVRDALYCGKLWLWLLTDRHVWTRRTSNETERFRKVEIEGWLVVEIQRLPNHFLVIMMIIEGCGRIPVILKKIKFCRH